MTSKHTEGITATGAAELVEGVVQSVTLQKLNVGMNQLGDIGVATFAAALTRNSILSAADGEPSHRSSERDSISSSRTSWTPPPPVARLPSSAGVVLWCSYQIFFDGFRDRRIENVE